MISKVKLIGLVIGLFLVDQIFKYIAIKYYPQLVSYNYGIVFGWIDNKFLVVLLLLVGFLIFIWLFVKSKKDFSLPLLLILSGATSNILDRFIYGGVVDYINLNFFTNFNLADVYIVVGSFWYIFKAIKYPKK
jgi:signal peptidase II